MLATPVVAGRTSQCLIPFKKPGDILGHEAMGIVEEVGHGVDRERIKVGDRVIIPFPMGCGNCFFCKQDLWSCCNNTNPKSYIGEAVLGQSTAGVFGYSQMTGGYAGGQAEYVPKLLDHIRNQRIAPSFVVTHRAPLSEAAEACELFRTKQDGCFKVVLDPTG